MSEVTRGGVPVSQGRSNTIKTPGRKGTLRIPEESVVTRRGKPVGVQEAKDRDMGLMEPPTPIRNAADDDEGVVHKVARDPNVIQAPRPINPPQSDELIDPSRYECNDCGVNTAEIGEFYMVNHELWQYVIPQKPDAFLCIECLETRLGRTLEPDDFLNAPINRTPLMFPSRPDMERSDRLKDRLGLPQNATWCYYHGRYETNAGENGVECFECKHQWPTGQALLLSHQQTFRGLGWPEEELQKLTISDVLSCPYCAHDLMDEPPNFDLPAEEPVIDQPMDDLPVEEFIENIKDEMRDYLGKKTVPQLRKMCVLYVVDFRSNWRKDQYIEALMASEGATQTIVAALGG